MELNTPPPSSQNPDSELSRQPAGAQPLADPIATESQDIYNQISVYPFHSDNDYLLGLAAIFGHPEQLPTEAELRENEDLVLQAQCFYFARKQGLTEGIDPGAYKEWLTLRASLWARSRSNGIEAGYKVVSPVPRPHAPTPATAAAASTLSVQPNYQTEEFPTSSDAATSADPAPPYPTSFADIVDLITQNKPIPGIEHIPDTVLEAGSSKVDRTVRRRKPWEKDEDEQQSELANETVDVESHKETGEGVLKILQAGAIPDSGLISKE